MKSDIALHAAEYRFADIVWQQEPIASGALARLCEERLGWKRTTTYTVLKKLCTKGILRNEGGTVTARVPREQVQRTESQALLERSFGGSLPMFLASFLAERRLSDEQAEELKALIDRHREGMP